MRFYNFGKHMNQINKIIRFPKEKIEYTFLLSYNTPVAVKVNDTCMGVKTLITTKNHSRTTSRHIGQWLNMIDSDDIEKVPQTEIERLFDL